MNNHPFLPGGIFFARHTGYSRSNGIFTIGGINVDNCLFLCIFASR